MYVSERLCLCLCISLCVCIRGGATLETLSLSLRPKDGGLVPAWYYVCYVMIDSGMVV